MSSSLVCLPVPQPCFLPPLLTSQCCPPPFCPALCCLAALRALREDSECHLRLSPHPHCLSLNSDHISSTCNFCNHLRVSIDYQGLHITAQRVNRVVGSLSSLNTLPRLPTSYKVHFKLSILTQQTFHATLPCPSLLAFLAHTYSLLQL